MLTELRKVIPAFLARVDSPDRGGRWTATSHETREALQAQAERARCRSLSRHAAEVTLTEFDPEGEIKIVAAALYAGSRSPGRRSCWRSPGG